LSDASPPQPRLAIRTFLLQGAVIIGIATILERGFQFIANFTSARIAGEENLGAYSLALQAAGSLASQASLGIGMVATRFSAEYPVGHPLNRAFIQRILQLSFVLALISALLMLVIAWPLAHWFYDKPAFFRILIMTVFTAPALVMLDALRGLLLGLSYYRGLVILSTVIGMGMLMLMPWAAGRSPRAMLLAHAFCYSVACITILLVLKWKYNLRIFDSSTAEVPIRGMLRFGALHLGSSIAVGLVPMVLMAMLLRYSESQEVTFLFPYCFIVQFGYGWLFLFASLAVPQMGFREVGYYTVASTMRNMITTIPGLLNQLTIGLMTRLRGDEFGGVNRVVLINTWLSFIFMVPVTALFHICLPWLLPLFYGKRFVEAVEPASYLLSVALVHMISQPAVNRLMVVSQRTLVYIQFIWIVVSLGSAYLLIPSMRASGVALSLLIAHIATALLVPLGLKLHNALPLHLTRLTLMGVLSGVLPLLVIYSHPLSLIHWTHFVILGIAGAMFYLVFRQYSEIRKLQ
jgi:O-antigen/teichoic acid export membrane protein